MPRPRLTQGTSSTDEAIAALARAGGGAFSIEEAKKQGIPPRAIRYRIETDRLLRLLPGVLVPAAVALDTHVRVSAARAWGGDAAVFSGFTSLWLQSVGDPPKVISMSTTKDLRCSVAWLRVRKVSELHRADVYILGRNAVSAPWLALFEVSPELNDVELGDLLDELRRRRLLSLARIRWFCTRTGRPRKGSARLLRLVQDREGHQVTESKLEDRVVRLLRVHRLPQPERQFIVRDHLGGFIGRMDFAYPERRLIIECDSYAHHSSKSSFERDREKWNRAMSEGWRIVWATWDSTRGRGVRFIKELQRQLNR